jgi:hypothetical protein
VHRWQDSIKVDAKEIGCKNMDFIYQAHFKVIEHHNELWAHLMENSLTRWMAVFQEVPDTMKLVQYMALWPVWNIHFLVLTAAYSRLYALCHCCFYSISITASLSLHPLLWPAVSLLSNWKANWTTMIIKTGLLLICWWIIYCFLWLSMFLLRGLFMS